MMFDETTKVREQFKAFLSNSPEALKWLKRKCYVNQTAYFPGDASVRDFREGRRSIFYEIRNLIKNEKFFDEEDTKELFIS